MATTYVKGKLRKVNGENIEIRYPETTLDKIVAWVNGSTAGVSILDSGRIKADYLPSTTVYTSGGTIAAGILPTIPVANIAVSGGTINSAILPQIPVANIAVSGGTIAQAILPAIPAANISGIISKTNLPSSVDDIVDIISVSESAPDATNVVIGDQYIKKTTSGSGSSATVTYKVVTATSDGTWTGASEDAPIENVIYYVPGTEKSYRYSGSSIVEIAAQRAVTTTVRVTGASDDLIPTELAVRTAITTSDVPIANNGTAGKVYIQNALTENSGSTTAITLNAADEKIHSVLANKIKGLSFDSTSENFVLNLGTGLTYDETSIAISLTGTLVGNAMTAGLGIASVTGGTITADLQWQADS